ncbi:MAG: hypothetical protein V3W18_14510 [candidate division Zixibacteria bacterium]
MILRNLGISLIAIVAVFGFFKRPDLLEARQGDYEMKSPEITMLYPELVDYKGKVKYFKPAIIPRLDVRCIEKPDFESWVATLEHLKNPPKMGPCIKVYYKKGKIRFIDSQYEPGLTGELYIIDGDTLTHIAVQDGRVSMMVTPVGVGMWECIYENGLLIRLNSYALGFDFEKNDYGFLKMWGYKIIEYWENTHNPKYVYSYQYFDLDPDNWVSRTEFDSNGKRLRSVINK